MPSPPPVTCTLRPVSFDPPQPRAATPSSSSSSSPSPVLPPVPLQLPQPQTARAPTPPRLRTSSTANTSSHDIGLHTAQLLRPVTQAFEATWRLTLECVADEVARAQAQLEAAEKRVAAMEARAEAAERRLEAAQMQVQSSRDEVRRLQERDNTCERCKRPPTFPPAMVDAMKESLRVEYDAKYKSSMRTEVERYTADIARSKRTIESLQVQLHQARRGIPTPPDDSVAISRNGPSPFAAPRPQEPRHHRRAESSNSASRSPSPEQPTGSRKRRREADAALEAASVRVAEDMLRLRVRTVYNQDRLGNWVCTVCTLHHGDPSSAVGFKRDTDLRTLAQHAESEHRGAWEISAVMAGQAQARRPG